MAKETEGWVMMSDGHKLYEKVWEPPTPTAHLVFLHGFSDHINAYYALFPTLASPPHNVAVHAFDQRGWGRSVTTPSQRGLTGPTTQVVSDISDYVSHVSKATGGKAPLFLMGHSMGGQELLIYTLSSSSSTTATTKPKIAGLLLESPYISLDPSSQPNGFTVFAGRLAAKVLPSRQMLQKLDSTYMSKDAKVRKDWEDDPLCHDTGTLQGLAGMLERSAQLSELAMGKAVPSLGIKTGCPVWLGHGSGDQVTSFEASRKFLGVLEEGDKTFREFGGAYHKLHAEPDGVGDGFAREVGEWIVERAKGGTGRGGGQEGGAKSKL